MLNVDLIMFSVSLFAPLLAPVVGSLVRVLGTADALLYAMVKQLVHLENFCKFET